MAYFVFPDFKKVKRGFSPAEKKQLVVCIDFPWLIPQAKTCSLGTTHRTIDVTEGDRSSLRNPSVAFRREQSLLSSKKLFAIP
jgi:hypothetical protein